SGADARPGGRTGRFVTEWRGVAGVRPVAMKPYAQIRSPEPPTPLAGHDPGVRVRRPVGVVRPAAEELCITASAIGKRISQLEAALGQPLFDRGSRGVSLTAAGHEYLDQIETALHLLSDISLHRRSRP